MLPPRTLLAPARRRTPALRNHPLTRLRRKRFLSDSGPGPEGRGAGGLLGRDCLLGVRKCLAPCAGPQPGHRTAAGRRGRQQATYFTRDSPPSRGRGALITVTGYRMASSWSPLLGRGGGGVDQRAEHRSRSRQSERPMNRGVRETQGRGKGPTHRDRPPRHRGRGPSPRFPSSSQRRAGALPAPRPERRPDPGPQNSRE